MFSPLKLRWLIFSEHKEFRFPVQVVCIFSFSLKPEQPDIIYQNYPTLGPCTPTSRQSACQVLCSVKLGSKKEKYQLPWEERVSGWVLLSMSIYICAIYTRDAPDHPSDLLILILATTVFCLVTSLFDFYMTEKWLMVVGFNIFAAHYDVLVHCTLQTFPFFLYCIKTDDFK